MIEKENFYLRLKAQAAFYFEQGIFSEWVWRCKRCGNTQITADLKKPPAFCECRHRDFEPPFLHKIERPPLEYYPEAKEILDNPLPIVLEELKQHVAGEERALTTIFLVSCMAKVKNTNATSSNLLINSASGSGKDFCVSAVVGLWDNNYAIMRSRISPTSLNYWHQGEPEWTWKGKILFLADISNAVLNSDTFRTMASGQNACTITEKSKALDIAIAGKPVFFLTSAFPNPNQELLRRFPILSLDETTSQTKQVLRFHGKRAANKTISGYNQVLRLALDFLQEHPVIVPFAEPLAELFPDSLPARTYFGRLIDFVKTSALLYQIKREQQNIDGIIHLIAQREDYELGAICFLSTALTASLIPLTSEQRKILQYFSENSEGGFSFSQLKEIPLFAGVAERTLRRQLDRLVSWNLLAVHTEKVGEYRPVQFFSFKSFSTITLPDWEEIQTIWQNWQNGNKLNRVAELAECHKLNRVAELAKLAESQESNDLNLSANSTLFANENALQNHQNANLSTKKRPVCATCGVNATVRVDSDRWLCKDCWAKAGVI